MTEPIRKLRPATTSKPIPVFDRVALALALTSAAAVPLAVKYFPDDDCTDANSVSEVARALRGLQARGAIAQGHASTETSHDCHFSFASLPAPQAQATTVIQTPPLVPVPETYAIAAGGTAPMTTPALPVHQSMRRGGMRRISPSPRALDLDAPAPHRR